MGNRHQTFYGTGISKLELCGKTIGWYINTNGAYAPPYETKPTKGEHDYNTCENCQKNIKTIHQNLTNRFEGTENKRGFPYCCAYHSNLAKTKDYKRADFVNAPELTAKKIIYTHQHIQNNYKTDNYYKEITDYIEYTVNSFGQMPNDCGEPLYVSSYLSDIKYSVEHDKDIPKLKRTALLEYFDNNYSDKEVEQTDLNILLNIYQKWLNIFPFEISFFGNLKNHFEKTLPFLSGKPEVNKYTGLATAKIHTKSSLIDALTNLTNSLITQLNSHSLYERGLLTEPDKVKLELILNERKLKLKKGYTNKSQNDEQRYRKILKAWFTDEKAFINEITPLVKTLLPQSKENTPPNRLQMIKQAVVTNKWANYELAEMRYNSAENWHQVVGSHFEGNTRYLNHSDIVLDTTNFPVITKGLTAYLLQNLGRSEQQIFDKYYENCLTRYKQVEQRKPGSSMRNLDIEFYSLHISQEKEWITFSAKLNPYLSKDEVELINQYTEAYFNYIQQAYAPKDTAESILSVSDWCIVFYFLDEAGTKAGNKIDRMKKFIENNNVVNPSSKLTTPKNFRKEYYEVENRINGKNNKNPLPPERIENILLFLKKNKKALQTAKNDIEHLSNQIE